MAITDWTSEGMVWTQAGIANSNPWRYMEAIRQAMNERLEVMPMPGSSSGTHPFLASSIIDDDPTTRKTGGSNPANIRGMDAIDNILDRWLGATGTANPTGENYGMSWYSLGGYWVTDQFTTGQPGTGSTMGVELGWWVNTVAGVENSTGPIPWTEADMLTAIGDASRIKFSSVYSDDNTPMFASWALQVYKILNQLVDCCITTSGTDMKLSGGTEYDGTDTNAVLATAKTNAEANYDADPGSTPLSSTLPQAWNSISTPGSNYAATLKRVDTSVYFRRIKSTASNFKRTTHFHAYTQKYGDAWDDWGEGYSQNEWQEVGSNATPNLDTSYTLGGLANNKPLPTWANTDESKGWQIQANAFARGFVVMKYDVTDGFNYQ